MPQQRQQEYLNQQNIFHESITGQKQHYVCQQKLKLMLKIIKKKTQKTFQLVFRLQHQECKQADVSSWAFLSTLPPTPPLFFFFAK